MNFKKTLITGSAFLLGALFACSDDSSSSNNANSASEDDTTPSSSTGLLASSSSVTQATTQMACSEIMFHGLDSLEWVEIYIASGEPLTSMAASELRLSGAVSLDFPDEQLSLGEYIVATNDENAFREKYANFTGRLFQWDAGKRLSNSGDVVSVKMRGEGDVDCSFDDDPPWPSLADGKGYSLVYLGGNASLAQNWAASKTLGGNPGSGEDPVFEALNVRINEVYPGDGLNDWIEFYNAGSSDADISGWQVIAKKRGDTLTVPDGFVVPAGGYKVFEDDALVLLSRGESLYLREFVDGVWTNSETGLEYPAVPGASEGSTAGIVELSDGTWAQGALATATKGAANTGSLLAGPLYINEIFYNPPDGQFEFMELVNLTSEAVPLSNTVIGSVSAVAWEFSGLGEIKNIGTTTVPANGIVLLLPDTIFTFSGVTEESYRTQLGLDDNVVILQYSGKISNRGERLVLKKPYAVTESSKTPGDKQYYYYWSDAVLYSDDGLWPKEADGAGMSLQRIDFTLPGSDPAAWKASTPTRGTI